MAKDTSAAGIAERLAREFLSRVWGPEHELDVIDELMTPDYVITSAGNVIRGREAFKTWVAEFHRVVPEAVDEILDVFANASGDRVAARWLCRGKSGGAFGLPANRRPIAFHGISVWKVRDGRLAECWVERDAPKYLD